jgi:hypothetical protein
VTVDSQIAKIVPLTVKFVATHLFADKKNKFFWLKHQCLYLLYFIFLRDFFVVPLICMHFGTLAMQFIWLIWLTLILILWCLITLDAHFKGSWVGWKRIWKWCLQTAPKWCYSIPHNHTYWHNVFFFIWSFNWRISSFSSSS